MAITNFNTWFHKTALGLVFLGSVSTSCLAQEWSDIGMDQQQILQPLRNVWDQIPANQKQQWLSKVPQLKGLNLEQLQRAQARMSEWASLSNAQRAQVAQHLKNGEGNDAATRAANWYKYVEQK